MKCKNITGHNTMTIGIIGISHGVGTTHLAIMLAVFLSVVYGQKGIVAELNDSDSLRQAGIILNNLFPKNNKLIKMISIRPSDIEQLSQVLSAGHDFVIIDFGCDYESARNQFLMCNMKIVVGSLSLWKLGDYVGFMVQREKDGVAKGWEYLASSGPAEAVGYLKKQFKINVSLIPCETDPFSLHEESLDFLHRLTGRL